MSEAGLRSDSYDAVVVGAGFGGLSAAASMARAGRHVLCVERQDGPGGCGHVFRRGQYVFDPAIHVSAQGHEGGLLDVHLRLLGVRDEVEFIKQEPLHGVDFPDLRLDLPVGTEAFIDAQARAFPAEAEGIRRFVELTVQVTKESQQVGLGLDLKELSEASERFPTFFRYRQATMQEAIEDCVSDPRVRALLGLSWPYLGAAPSKLPYILWAAMLVSMLESGPVYVRGSYQVLADAYATALERSGGELLLNTSVARIAVENGSVQGVALEDGTFVRSPIVVSGADATHTLDELVGAEHLPKRLVKRYRSMTLSPSAFVVYSATSLDVTQFDVAHETFVHPSWDHDQIYADMLTGKPGGTWITIPTLHDATLAPGGEHIVIFTTLTPYDIGEPWAQAEPRYRGMLVEQIERLLPGYSDSITYMETATPETIERYTRNRGGAVYGWENLVSQNMPKRLPQVMPVEGLFLAGHWTHPGSGSFRAMYSGLVAAQLALGYATTPEFFDALAQGAGVPQP